MSGTPGRRRTDSSPTDTRLPRPGRPLPGGARQGPGSLGWPWRLELQHHAAWGGPRAGASLAPAGARPRCSRIARTPPASFTDASTLGPASTTCAGEHVERKRPFQQPGPIQARRALLPRLLHRRGKGRALLLQPRLLPHLREQKWPHFRAWSEDAVEPREVGPRRRHQRRQTTEELQPGEEEVRGAVGQRALHPVRQAAILHSRQALQRQSAARPVAA